MVTSYLWMSLTLVTLLVTLGVGQLRQLPPEILGEDASVRDQFSPFVPDAIPSKRKNDSSTVSFAQPNLTPNQPNLTPNQPNLTPNQPNLTPNQPNLTTNQPNLTPNQIILSSSLPPISKDATSTPPPPTTTLNPIFALFSNIPNYFFPTTVPPPKEIPLILNASNTIVNLPLSPPLEVLSEINTETQNNSTTLAHVPLPFIFSTTTSPSPIKINTTLNNSNTILNSTTLIPRENTLRPPTFPPTLLNVISTTINPSTPSTSILNPSTTPNPSSLTSSTRNPPTPSLPTSNSSTPNFSTITTSTPITTPEYIYNVTIPVLPSQNSTTLAPVSLPALIIPTTLSPPRISPPTCIKMVSGHRSKGLWVATLRVPLTPELNRFNDHWVLRMTFSQSIKSKDVNVSNAILEQRSIRPNPSNLPRLTGRVLKQMVGERSISLSQNKTMEDEAFLQKMVLRVEYNLTFSDPPINLAAVRFNKVLVCHL